MSPLLLFIFGGATGIAAQEPIKRGLRRVARGGITVTRGVRKFYADVKEDIEDVAAEMDSERADDKAKAAEPPRPPRPVAAGGKPAV